MTKSRNKIINCHTHIFTGEHVPAYLAKTIVPWPFYLLLNVHWIIGLFKFYYDRIDKLQYQPWFRHLKLWRQRFNAFVAGHLLIRLIASSIWLIITIHALFIVFGWVGQLLMNGDGTGTLRLLHDAQNWLITRNLLLLPSSTALQVLVVILILGLFRNSRRLFFFLSKFAWRALRMLPTRQLKDLWSRYILMGRYAFHKTQWRVFSKLQQQYPTDTAFVVLPMDMEYMKAGSVREPFYQQMQVLAALKARNQERLHPFVFVDPRRIRDQNDFFRYQGNGDGEVGLLDCFIRDYIEDKGFSGFKIYPALGYYPFDEALLPLWKYAADRGLPILTHCIRGVIYYRGRKQKQWNEHPVFRQVLAEDTLVPLVLPEQKAKNFSVNFTHPLNYLCLLEEELLRVVVGRCSEEVKELFGYSDEETPLQSDLRHLKLCFGHYGGEDEWKRYMEQERDQYSQQILKNGQKGIDFMHNDAGQFSHAKLEQLWKQTDWYSVISSMMMQYPNVYSDISYIVHDATIFALLKQTLSHRFPQLRKRVLFGTDFYVVRNHKSDRNLIINTVSGLSEEEFELITFHNPMSFLNH